MFKELLSQCIIFLQATTQTWNRKTTAKDVDAVDTSVSRHKRKFIEARPQSALAMVDVNTIMNDVDVHNVQADI